MAPIRVIQTKITNARLYPLLKISAKLSPCFSYINPKINPDTIKIKKPNIIYNYPIYVLDAK
tara:strand:+ start:810 stop:995 length:186 start_codon:yes stop_codon:yes gene_type:complete